MTILIPVTVAAYFMLHQLGLIRLLGPRVPWCRLGMGVGMGLGIVHGQGYR